MARWIFEKLEARRVEKGYTLTEIATATGLPLATVRQYVKGFMARPDLDKLAAIARYMGLTLGDLLVQEDDPGEAVRSYAEEVWG